MGECPVILGGTGLVLRQPRRLVLTEQGKALSPTLTETFDRLASATAEVQETAHNIRIKVPPTFAIRWLIPRLQQFQEEEANPEILLNTGWNPVNFIRENFDGGIVCASDVDRYDQTIEAELVVREYLTPVCSPSLLEGGPPLRKPSDLLQFTLLHGTELLDVWQAWFELIGMDVKLAGKSQHFDLMDTAVHAAIRGIGVVLAPQQFVMDEVDLGQLVVPFPEITAAVSGYYFVSPKTSTTRRGFQKFRRWLIDTGRADGGQDVRCDDLGELHASSPESPALELSILEKSAPSKGA